MERRYFLAGHRKVTLMPNLLAEVAVFLTILIVGYIWAYKKGALEWV